MDESATGGGEHSGMFGHRVDASLGMGQVNRPHAITPGWIAATGFEIGVTDRCVPAWSQRVAWCDPKNEKERN